MRRRSQIWWKKSVTSASSTVSRLGTHVISAILNLGQEVEEDWPLYIKDHQGHHHQVLLAPGEMVWYESAKLVHGRMQPFNGKFFDNMFVHFRPRGEWYRGTPTYDIGQKPREEGPLTKEMIIASR